MNELSHNLFSNFQSTVYKAVKAFLKKEKEGVSTTPITTSLRIPAEIKDFYECLALSEKTSINTAIVNTLGKVKDQTVAEYKKTYSKINDAFDQQVNRLLKIFDTYQVDYNDLCSLLEWATGNMVSRSDLSSKERLINLIDKKAQQKLCKLFGYNYEWIQSNDKSIYYQWPNFESRWYKHVVPFVQSLINNFYLDETVESFQLSFLCSDNNVINNILSRAKIDKSESITPIAIVTRVVNGIPIRTYHRFESNDINYEKCRAHFVVLAKTIMMLVKHRVISYPSGYEVTPEQHDKILDGSMHLRELFNYGGLRNSFFVDDLEDIEPRSFDVDSTGESSPSIYQVLDTGLISNLLLHHGSGVTSFSLTPKIAARYGMDKRAFVKYLQLFELGKDSLSGHIVDCHGENIQINLDYLRDLNETMNETKLLDTAFG